MGLLYPLPASREEKDFVHVRAEGLEMRSYGLPWLFWGYAAAFLTAVLFLWLAVRPSLHKLAALGDGTDQALVTALELFLLALPVATLGFLFYEKRVAREGNVLRIEHRVFAVPWVRRRHHLAPHPFTVGHHMDAPNMARLRGGEAAVGFQNKGYFELRARLTDGQEIVVDRHSRKGDLLGLMSLLDLQ